MDKKIETIEDIDIEQHVDTDIEDVVDPDLEALEPLRRRGKKKRGSESQSKHISDDDRKLIDEFIAKKGITKLPPMYASGAVKAVLWNFDDVIK